MSSTHRLAAIMFTDIVGYTALMNRDESTAMALLARNRELQSRLIKQFGGTFLKEMGDGTLASFNSATDAILCAGAIQNSAREHDLTLRIGIHQGEVVYKDGDVFGDGVNIASRIEPLAESGGIIVTESVHRNVGNKTGITTAFLGEHELKNVRDKWNLYSVLVDSSVLDLRESANDRNEGKARLTPPLKWGMIGIAVIALVLIVWQNWSAVDIAPNQDMDLSEKRIAVLTFDNPTGNEELEGFWHLGC